MADGFTDSFLLIIKIIKWIVLFVWYSTLALLFLLSFVFLWRIPCIFYGLKGNCNISQNGFQTFLLSHLAIITFDILRFPFIVFCYLSFTRRGLIHDYLFTDFHDNYFGAYDRSIVSTKHLALSLWFFIRQFAFNMIETLLVLLSLPSILIFTRSIGFVHFLRTHQQTKTLINHVVPVWILFLNYPYGIVDIIAYVMGVLSLLCVTRIPRLSRVCIIFAKLLFPGATRLKRSDHDNTAREYTNSLLFDFYHHRYLISNLVFGLTDYVLIILNICVSIIAWPRFYGLINAIKHCSKDMRNKFSEYPFLYKLLIRNFLMGIPEMIGLILFVINLLFITRWYHSIQSLILNYSNKEDKNTRTRNANDPDTILHINKNIIVSMGVSIIGGIIDYVTVILTILRIVPFFKIIKRNMHLYWSDQYHFSVHGYLCCSAGLLLCDLVVLPFALIGIVCPTRMVRAFYLWWNFIRCKCCGYREPNWPNYWSGFKMVSYDIAFRFKALKNSLYGVIDLLCCLIGLVVFLLFSFHRIPCFWRCAALLFDNLTNKNRKENYSQLREYHIWSCLAFTNPFIAITDLFIFIPLFLIAFITHPMSTIQSLTQFSIDWVDHPLQLRKLIRYNWGLRVQFATLAVFGLLDTLCVLLSIPSILLRPLAFARISKTLYNERWASIEVRTANRFKIYAACFLNVLYEIIDLFAIAGFIIDCVLLIRLYHISNHWIRMIQEDKIKYGKKDTQNHANAPVQDEINIDHMLRFDVAFRWSIVSELCWSLLDWLTVVMTIPAIVIPTRFFAFWYILYRGRHRYTQDVYHSRTQSLFVPLFTNLLYAFVDLFIIPIGILATVLPTRIPTMLYLWLKFIVQCATTLPCVWNSDEAKAEENEAKIHSKYHYIFVLKPNTQSFNKYIEMRYNKEFRFCLLQQLFIGIGDVISIVIGLPSLVIVSRSIAYVKCVRYLIDLPMFDCSNRFVHKYGYLKHHHIWKCCLKNLGFALLDLFYLIFGLIPAMITSPISLYHTKKTYKYNVQNRLDIVSANKNQSSEYKVRNYSQCLLQYNWNMRWVILKLGFWGFVNLLFGVLNICGFIRFASMWRLHKSLIETHGYLHQTFIKQRLTIYGAILKNIVLSIVDIIFILLFVFNSLGLIRCYHSWNSHVQMRKADTQTYTVKREQKEEEEEQKAVSIGADIEDKKQTGTSHTVDSLLYEATYWEFRLAILKNVVFTITDWIIVVVSFPSIIIPTRTFAWFWILYSHFTDYKRDTYHSMNKDERLHNLYYLLLTNLAFGLGDLLIIPLGVLFTLAPTRCFAMIYIWFKFMYQCVTTLPCVWPNDKDHKQDSDHSIYYQLFIIRADEKEEYKMLRYNKRMRYQILKECGYAFGDLLSLTIALPSIIVPTRTVAYLKLVYLLVELPCFDCQTAFKHKYGNVLSHDYLWLGCVKNLGYALLDLLCYSWFLFLCVVLISWEPLRATRQRKRFNVELKLSRHKDQMMPQLDALVYLLQYNWTMRNCIVRIAVASLINVVFLLLSIPSLLIRTQSARRISTRLILSHGHIQETLNERVKPMHIQTKNELYAQTMLNIAYSLLDLLLFIPLFVLNCLCLVRLYHQKIEYDKMRQFDVAAITQGLSNQNIALYDWDFRRNMCFNLLKSLRDIVVYLFTFLSVLMPTRTVAYFWIIGQHVEQYKNDTYSETMHAFLIQNVGLAAKDLLFIPMGLAALVFPTKSVGIIVDWLKFFKKTIFFCNCHTDFIVDQSHSIVSPKGITIHRPPHDSDEDGHATDRFVMEESKQEDAQTPQDQDSDQVQLMESDPKEDVSRDPAEDTPPKEEYAFDTHLRSVFKEINISSTGFITVAELEMSFIKYDLDKMGSAKAILKRLCSPDQDTIEWSVWKSTFHAEMFTDPLDIDAGDVLSKALDIWNIGPNTDIVEEEEKTTTHNENTLQAMDDIATHRHGRTTVSIDYTDNDETLPHHLNTAVSSRTKKRNTQQGANIGDDVSNIGHSDMTGSIIQHIDVVHAISQQNERSDDEDEAKTLMLDEEDMDSRSKPTEPSDNAPPPIYYGTQQIDYRTLPAHDQELWEIMRYDAQFRTQCKNAFLYGLWDTINLFAVGIWCLVSPTRWLAYFRMFVILSDFRIGAVDRYIATLIWMDKETEDNRIRKGREDDEDRRYWKYYSSEIYNALFMNTLFAIFFDILCMSWILLLAFVTRCVATVKAFFEYSWQNVFDSATEDKYAFSQARILRYNQTLREVLINVALYGVLDTIFVVIGLPSVVLRPVAYARLLELLWYERKEIISRKPQRMILYKAFAMNTVYAMMDSFFDLCFVLGIVLMIRMPFVLKKYADLLYSDHENYNKMPHQFGYEPPTQNDDQKEEEEDDEKMEQIEETRDREYEYLTCGDSVRNDTVGPFAWSEGEIARFDVRGKNYFVGGKKNKKAKIKSDGSLYQVFAVDTFRTSVKMRQIAQFYDIPHIIKTHCNDVIKNRRQSPLPPLLIVSLMLPGDSRDAVDGLHIVLFAKISNKTRAFIAVNAQNSESIQLSSNFMCNVKDKDVQNANHWRKKLKMTIDINNMDDLTLNFMMKKLANSNNGKSFVPNELASFDYRTDECFMIDVDAYNVSSMIKNALNANRDQLDNAIYNLSFHIAGSNPNELPEQLLFAAKINKIGWKNAVKLGEQYTDYVSQHQAKDDDLDSIYPLSEDWLLRYNWSFRAWCVKNLLWSLLDVLALAISTPGIILRPVTWWRCLNGLWNEHMKEQVSWRNLGKIFIANILNAVFGIIDIVFYVLSAFVVLTGLRFIHFKKDYHTMKHQYDAIDKANAAKRKSLKLKKQKTKVLLSEALSGNVRVEYKPFVEKHLLCAYKFLLEAGNTNIDFNEGLSVANLVRYDLTFRWRCIYNAGRSVFDWFNFIATFVIVLIPSRSWSYVHIIKHFKQDYFEDNYLHTMFRFLWINFVLSIHDLWILPMGLLALISITRHTRMRMEWSSYLHHTICFEEDHPEDALEEKVNEEQQAHVAPETKEQEESKPSIAVGEEVKSSYAATAVQVNIDDSEDEFDPVQSLPVLLPPIHRKVTPVLMLSTQHWSYVLKYDFEFRISCILQCVLGIIDLFVLVVCLPCLLAIPRAPSYVRCYLLLARFNRQMKLHHLLSSVTDQFVWFILLINLGTALLDFILFPLFVLALVTRPFSCYKVLRTLFKARKERHLRMKNEGLLYDPKFADSDKSKIMAWDTDIRKKFVMLSILGPIELIGVLFAIATIWTRPLAWKRCGKLLWKRRKAGSTDLKKHKMIYIALGLNAVCCIIDAVFTIPIAIVDLLLIPFGTIHTLVAFKYMTHMNDARPTNKALFDSIEVYDDWYKQKTNRNINGHLTQEQKDASNTFNKKMILDLLRFDVGFRKYLALTLVLAFVDLIIFVVTLPALLVPWRIWGYINIYEYHWENYKRLDYNEMRLDLFRNLFLAFLDILVLPFAILSLVFPTKMDIMARGWLRFLSNWSFCQTVMPSSSHYLRTERDKPESVGDESIEELAETVRADKPKEDKDDALDIKPLTTDGRPDERVVVPVVHVTAPFAPSAPIIEEDERIDSSGSGDLLYVNMNSALRAPDVLIPLRTEIMSAESAVLQHAVQNSADIPSDIDEEDEDEEDGTLIDIPVMESHTPQQQLLHIAPSYNAANPTHAHMNTLEALYEDAVDVVPSMDFDAEAEIKKEQNQTEFEGLNKPPPAFNTRVSAESFTGHTTSLLEGIYQGALEELEDVQEDSAQAPPQAQYGIQEESISSQNTGEDEGPLLAIQEREESSLIEHKEEEKMEQTPDVDGATHGEVEVDLLNIGDTIQYQEMKSDIYPNTSVTYEQEVHAQCDEFVWTNCDAKSFKVRSGNYFVNQSKDKTFSDDSLYDMFAVDVYQTPVKLNDITQFIDVRDAVQQYKLNRNTFLPPLFIVNLMIPGEDEYSNGMNIVLYAKLSDKAKQMLMVMNDVPNAFRFLNEFINDCDALNLSDGALYGKDSLINRFKVGARIMNLSHSSLGFVMKKMIPKKKGGTFFAEEWATFYHEPGQYFALDVDTYSLSGSSKSALNSARSSLNSIVFDLYFYLGAKELSDTPEQIISCCRLSKIVPDRVPVFPVQRFGIPVPRRTVQNKNNDAYKPQYEEQLWQSLRYDSAFRKFSIWQCLVGIADLIVLLLSFVSIASIIRLPTYWRSFVLLCDFSDSHCLYKAHELLHKKWSMSKKGRTYIYGVLLMNVCISIVDIAVFLPLILISVASIVRIPSIYHVFKRHIQNETAYEQHEALIKYNKAIRIEIAKCAMLGVLDWVVVIITLPSILRLGAWMRCLDILQRLWTSHKVKKSLDIKTHLTVYKALLLNLPCMVLMYITFGLLAINVVLVVRAYHTLKDLKELNEKDEMKYQRDSYMEEGDRINWNKLSAAQLLRWSWSFRKKAVQNILWSVFDISVMIAAIPGLPRLLICSRRSPRFASTNKEESDSDSDSDDKEKSVVHQKASDLYHWFGWFFIENVENYKADKYGYARKALLLNTFLTLFDLFIVLPFALPTFILRGRFVLNSFKSQSYQFEEQQGIPYNFQPGQAMPNKKKSKRSYKTLKVLDYDMELRVFLVINFFLSIFDLIIALLTIPSILVPTRTRAYFAVLYKYYWRDQGGHLPQMRRLLFLNLLLALYDVLNLIPLIYNIILPTRYLHVIRALDIECIKKRKIAQYQQRLDQEHVAEMPEPEVPTAPVIYDEDDQKDVELQEERHQLMPGDGAQPITYSAPYKQQIDDGAQQVTYSDVSHQPPQPPQHTGSIPLQEEVVLQIEDGQPQNEGVHENNTLHPVQNDHGESIESIPLSTDEVRQDHQQPIAPSAPIVHGIDEDQKASIALSTDEIRQDHKQPIVPSAPIEDNKRSTDDIGPVAFEKPQVVHFNKEYQETTIEEEKDDDDEEDDDQDVLNDGETPGMTLPAAQSIPMYDDEESSEEDPGRLNKDEEDIHVFEAQKAELIMDALPGQSERQFLWKELRFNMEFRTELWRSAYHGTMDDAALVLALLSVLVSFGLRAKHIGQCTKKYWPKYYANDYSHWRYGCLFNLLFAFWDILCLIGFVITICCIVRIIPLYDQCKYDTVRTTKYGISRYTNWTKYAWRNALFSPLDLLFLPFAVIVLLSPHIIDMYHEYLSFKSEYMKHSKLIVQFGNEVSKEGELPPGGQFRITYSSLDIMSMFKVRLLLLRHALHWIFVDILVLVPMLVMSFIYWLVIWPTLKYVTMSQWNDFKTMVNSGFLCCLKSLKCCKEKEKKPVHDGPTEIVDALNQSNPNDVPSAPPGLGDESEEEEKAEEDKPKKKVKVQRNLETAGEVYYSLTHCIRTLFLDVVRILIIQFLAFVLKLIMLKVTQIGIQFKRLALNYKRFKLDYDPWRVEEDVYKYAEDEKEFSYWCLHGMSRQQANAEQLLQEETLLDKHMEKHLMKVRKVYQTWLLWMENEKFAYEKDAHERFRLKMPFPEETKARWRLKLQQVDEMIHVMEQLDAGDSEEDAKADNYIEVHQIADKYKQKLSVTSNIEYVRQEAQKRTSSIYSDAHVTDEVWKQVRAEEHQSTTKLAFQSISEFFTQDLPTFFMTLFCLVTVVRATVVIFALPLIWGCECGANKGKAAHKKQERELERKAMKQEDEFLNFDTDQGYQDLAFSTNKENEARFRKIVQDNAKQVFLDLVYVPFGIFATISIVRTIPFLKLFFVSYSADDYADNRAQLRRKLCIAECMRAIRDLLCLPLCVVMLLTPWRLWRIYKSIDARSNHCVQMARKYSDEQIMAAFEGSFNSDQYVKVQSICTEWNSWGAPIVYMILRKYKFEQKKEFEHHEHVSFLQRYWNEKKFDKAKGYAPPINPNMTLYKFKEEGYLPTRGCAYLLGKQFWRNIFRTFGLNTSLLYLQKNPMSITYQYFINDRDGNQNKEFTDFKRKYQTQDDSRYEDDDDKHGEEYEEFGMMIRAQIDPIVQRGSCIDVLREILSDSNQMSQDRSPVIQFQDEEGRILMSFYVSAQDVLQSSLKQYNRIRSFDLDIHSIKECIAVHSSYKYYYDKIVSSSSWNTFWWSSLREFVACLYDIPHIILYLATWILPWRGILLTYKLRLHPVYRNRKIARRCIAMVQYSNVFLSRFRELLLVRSANDIMKDSLDGAEANYYNIWDNFWNVVSGQWRELNEEANKMNESDIPMFLISIDDINKEVEKHLFHGCASNLSNVLHLDRSWHNYLNLQRDKLYYTILRIESNVETYIKHSSDEVVRSVILERINKDVRGIDESLHLELNTIENASNELMKDVQIQTQRVEVQQQKKCISGYVTYKSQTECHGSIRRQCLKCVADVFAVVGILIMLLFHGMELIAHLKQLFGYHWKHRHSEKRPDLRFGVRELIKYHAKYCCLDLYYLLQTIVCLLIIVITLVRVDGFMVDVSNASVSLNSNRRLTLREFSEICWCNVRYKIWGELYELLTLVTILKHWKRALYSIGFAIFVATQGFQGLATLITLNSCCKACPTSIRVLLQLIMWLGFAGYMFWQLYFVMDDFEVNVAGQWQLSFAGKDAANDFTLYVLGCTCIAMIAQFISDYWLSISTGEKKKHTILKLWWFDIHKDHISAKISISWPNLLHFIFIIFELLQFTALPIFVLTQVSILKDEANLADNEAFLAHNYSWHKFANFVSTFLFISDGADLYFVMLLTVICIFVYLFVIAAPWAFGREQQEAFCNTNDETEEASLNEFVQFKKWYYSAWFFSQIIFVPFLINILKLLQCYWIQDTDTGNWNGYVLSDVSSLANAHKYQCFMDEGYSGKLYSFLIILTIGCVFYIFTVLAVMPQLFFRATLVAQDGLDIRFPLAFSGGWQLFGLLYVICIMFLPLVTTNPLIADNATLMGCVLCLMMFLWTFVFECLAKGKLKDIDTGYEDIRMCTVPHVAMIRRYGILLPLLMCVYVRYLQTLDQEKNNGHWTKIAVFVIIFVSVMVCIAYVFVKRRSLNVYRNNFKASPLYAKLTELIDKCRQTGEGEWLGSWYSESSTVSDWRYSLENAFTLSKAKSVVLQLEHYIVIERLSHTFLHERTKWRNHVMECEDYVALENLLNELVDSIQPLPSYHLSLRILINDCDYLREAPIDISLLLLSFLYDNNALATQISQKPFKPAEVNAYHFNNTKFADLISELFRTSKFVIYGLLNDINDDEEEEEEEEEAHRDSTPEMDDWKEEAEHRESTPEMDDWKEEAEHRESTPE
eukprot:48729_1